MTAQQIATVTDTPRRSVLVTMASRYNMEPAAFEQTLRATVFPEKGSREQFAAFLVVANEYGLNPLTKEIYAFPTQRGGVQPIVSIDGWCNLINSHPQCNGIEFDDHLTADGKLVSITARIWRKDREKPVTVTEYMDECKRATEPWQKWPRRMLRHKALIQAARYAFGFAGIVDPDEAERMGADTSRMRDVTPRDDPPDPPPAPVEPEITGPKVIAADGGAVIYADDPAPAPKPNRAERQRAAVAAQADPLAIPEYLDRAPKPAIPSPDDTTAFLAWIDKHLGGAATGDELEARWNDDIAPRIDGWFPPDQDEAMGLYRKHEARIAP